MSKTKRLLILAVIVSVVLSIAAVASNEIAVPLTAETSVNPWPTSIRGVTPDLYPGNNTETQFPSDYYYKDDSPSTGAVTYYHDAEHYVTVTIGEGTSGQCITNWTAVGIKIDYFVVKSGSDFFMYNYSLLNFFWDGNLYPNLNPAGNNPAISHWAIYYSLDDTEETTTIELTTESIPLQSETTTETTTEATTTETTTEATTTETTTEATTTETTTEATTTETTTEATTTETTTEATTTEITTEATTTGIELTTESIPLQSETTDPSQETITETTTGTQPTSTTIVLTTEDIPRTGETGSGNGLLIGLILLIMAGGLTIVVYRSKAVMN